MFQLHCGRIDVRSGVICNKSGNKCEETSHLWDLKTAVQTKRQKGELQVSEWRIAVFGSDKDRRARVGHPGDKVREMEVPDREKGKTKEDISGWICSPL